MLCKQVSILCKRKCIWTNKNILKERFLQMEDFVYPLAQTRISSLRWDKHANGKEWTGFGLIPLATFDQYL